MEIQKADQVKLVHDLNTALYHVKAVAKYLKRDTVDEDMIILQDSAHEKIKNALDLLMTLAKQVPSMEGDQ